MDGICEAVMATGPCTLLHLLPQQRQTESFKSVFEGEALGMGVQLRSVNDAVVDEVKGSQIAINTVPH